jgi:mRNA-degrading endonuclease RelE of RelBE toxin-antitoxin system
MPARFTVRLTPSFTHDLERLPPSIQDKILETVKRLETTPAMTSSARRWSSIEFGIERTSTGSKDAQPFA